MSLLYAQLLFRPDGTFFTLDGELDAAPEIVAWRVDGHELPGGLGDGLEVGEERATTGTVGKVRMIGQVLAGADELGHLFLKFLASHGVRIAVHDTSP
ncbi:MAG TPA: hypothetical protein VN151_12870 [Terracidiphilus sp.]|nr:hypothetical protein [Terracidiphilus sp.]